MDGEQTGLETTAPAGSLVGLVCLYLETLVVTRSLLEKNFSRFLIVIDTLLTEIVDPYMHGTSKEGFS